MKRCMRTSSPSSSKTRRRRGTRWTRVRAFIRKNPTVYCSTHTPLGYEHLEAKRVMDLDNPVENPPPGKIAVNQATGKHSTLQIITGEF